MKKVINLIIITIAILLCVFIKKDYLNSYKEKIVINKPIIEEKIIEVNAKENTKLPEEYLGYLAIESINIKAYILNGTDDTVLNKNVIGVHKASVLLDDSIGNIILAGHNNKTVFGNLRNIKVNDQIILMTKIACYKFKVIDITIYNKNDYSYYKYIENEKLLTLITCYGNNDYRLVVTAKEESN